VTRAASGDPVKATEHWFYAHGLPYFVVSEQREVDEALGRGRLSTVAGAAVVLAAAAGVGVGLWDSAVSTGVLAAMILFGAVLAGYAVVELRIWPILRWTLRRTLGSLRLVFPLVTRALPLLMLFITFLFINADVWQVAADMQPALLWVVVLLFSGLAVVFLLVQLPEEVDRVSQDRSDDHLRERVRGSPLAQAAEGIEAAEVDQRPVRGLQRANLLLVLLVAQVTQVLVLSLAVFAFFILFGALTISPRVINIWLGHGPTALGASWLGSLELLQVSVFLAAFSGLYFTVAAVTDQLYREQFFTNVSDELERAVSVRAVYLALRGRRPAQEPGRPAP
jgi:membrane protein YdbS with pleckstrin-like domain